MELVVRALVAATAAAEKVSELLLGCVQDPAPHHPAVVAPDAVPVAA